MDRKEIYKQFEEFIEASLVDAGYNNWSYIKNATIGKELIAYGARVLFQSQMYAQKFTDNFGFDTISKPALADIANFFKIPLSWVRPTVLYCYNLDEKVGFIDTVIKNNKYAGYVGYKNSQFKLYQYSSIEKITGSNATILIGDTPLSGIKLVNPIIELLRIEKDGKYMNVSLFGSDSIPFINLKDGSIFIPAESNVTITNYVASTEVSDITAQDVQNVGNVLFTEVIQGEASDDVARKCLQQLSSFNTVLASEQSIKYAVNAFPNVTDCAVEVVNSKVNVYCKMNKSTNVIPITLELNSYGILGYNYEALVANSIQVTLIITGVTDNAIKAKINEMLAQSYEDDKMPFDWIPSIIELRARVQEIAHSTSIDVSFLVETSVTEGVRFKPVEGSIDVVDVNGIVVGYDVKGVLYVLSDKSIRNLIPTAGSTFGYWSSCYVNSEDFSNKSYEYMVSYNYNTPTKFKICNIQNMLGYSLENVRSYSWQGYTFVVDSNSIRVYDNSAFTERNSDIKVESIASWSVGSSYKGTRSDAIKKNNYAAVNSEGKECSRPLAFIKQTLYCNEKTSTGNNIVSYTPEGVKQIIASIGDYGECRGAIYDGNNVFILYNNKVSVVINNLNQAIQYIQVLKCNFASDASQIVDVLIPEIDDIHIVLASETSLMPVKIKALQVTNLEVTAIGLTGNVGYIKSDGLFNNTVAPVVGGVAICDNSNSTESIYKPTIHIYSDSVPVEVEVNTSNVTDCNQRSIAGYVNYDTGDIDIVSNAYGVKFKSYEINKNSKAYITLSSAAQYE